MRKAAWGARGYLPLALRWLARQRIASDEARRSGDRRVWYFLFWDYCPACNRLTVSRQRRYGPRPDDWHQRHLITEVWDGCD